MSIERELLRRISSHSESRIPLHFIKEIQQLLTQPELSTDSLHLTEQEPVAWMYDWTNEIGELSKGVYVGSHKASHLYELANLVPLYLTPPKREPLSDERLRDLSNSIHAYPDFGNVSVWQAFYMGRAIEKAHGITGGVE
jgi:hypothetical protein